MGVELNQAAPSAKLPPVIAKPTYRMPMKNLRATCYITSELAGTQQQAMELHGEASGTWHDNRIVVAARQP
jgi:hypothetical protein